MHRYVDLFRDMKDYVSVYKMQELQPALPQIRVWLCLLYVLYKPP